jgi:hypothetical protein
MTKDASLPSHAHDIPDNELIACAGSEWWIRGMKNGFHVIPWFHSRSQRLYHSLKLTESISSNSRVTPSTTFAGGKYVFLANFLTRTSWHWTSDYKQLSQDASNILFFRYMMRSKALVPRYSKALLDNNHQRQK